MEEGEQRSEIIYEPSSQETSDSQAMRRCEWVLAGPRDRASSRLVNESVYV